MNEQSKLGIVGILQSRTLHCSFLSTFFIQFKCHLTIYYSKSTNHLMCHIFIIGFYLRILWLLPGHIKFLGILCWLTLGCMLLLILLLICCQASKLCWGLKLQTGKHKLRLTIEDKSAGREFKLLYNRQIVIKLIAKVIHFKCQHANWFYSFIPHQRRCSWAAAEVWAEAARK